MIKIGLLICNGRDMINDSDVLIIYIIVVKVIICLCVISFWYLRWRWMVKNFLVFRVVIFRNDVN